MAETLIMGLWQSESVPECRLPCQDLHGESALPPSFCRTVLLPWPYMLATGGSSVAAIRMLKERGCQKIHFMCILAAPEGGANALDPEYTTEVLDVIQELKEDGLHFIIVTHEMGFARHACDKAAFLCGGSLMEYGESAQLFGQPETEQLHVYPGCSGRCCENAGGSS